MSNCLRGQWRMILLSLPLFMLLPLGTGCNAMEVMRSASYFTQPNTEKIDAEYAGLPGRKVVVYVWAKPETMWDYPEMRLDLSSHLEAYLREHVKNVEIVKAAQVEAHIKSLASMNPEPADIARHFHADTAIHISIYKFSMRDPGMSQFYRGRISASVVVVDASAKDGTVRRVPLQDVVTIIPEEGPLGYHNVNGAEIRDMTYREFTQTTGRKFHQWEKEVK